MISKEQYLQAKKTVADYELQEWLFGNSELLKPPVREVTKSPLQEAMDRGYRKGAVVKAGTEWTLTSDPYMEDGEVRCQSWLDGVESPVTIRIVDKEGEYTVKLIKAP